MGLADLSRGQAKHHAFLNHLFCGRKVARCCDFRNFALSFAYLKMLKLSVVSPYGTDFVQKNVFMLHGLLLHCRLHIKAWKKGVLKPQIKIYLVCKLRFYYSRAVNVGLMKK